jgi:hypothetical protein
MPPCGRPRERREPRLPDFWPHRLTPVETNATLNDMGVTVTPLDAVLDRLRDDVIGNVAAQGFSVPTAARTSAFEALLLAFRIETRSILPRRRDVVRSKELAARTLPTEAAAAVSVIQRESETGIDLNPRLSRQYFRGGFNDALLNDLNIQHFHLGDRGSGPNGMVGGSSELLFVIVTDDTLFFVDLLDHSAFSSEDFLERMATNWPNLLRVAHGLKGSGESSLTPQERASLRAAGVTVFVERDGMVLPPPGGGTTTSGTSVKAVDRAMNVLRRVRDLHARLVAAADEVASSLNSAAGRALSHLDIDVRRHDESDAFCFELRGAGILILPDGRLFIPHR